MISAFMEPCPFQLNEVELHAYVLSAAFNPVMDWIHSRSNLVLVCSFCTPFCSYYLKCMQKAFLYPNHYIAVHFILIRLQPTYNAKIRTN